MSCIKIAGLSLTLSLFSGSLLAQEEDYGPAKSDLLLAFSGTYRYSHAEAPPGPVDEVESLSARFSAGLYLDRSSEFGLELLPNVTRLEETPDTYDVYLGTYYNYNHWSSPRTTLYAGPQLGVQWIDGSESENALAYGLHAGMRYWITTDVCLNVEPRLSIVDFDDDALGGQTSNVDIFFGISFKL